MIESTDWPFTGRREELAALARMVTDSQSRGVVLAGPPGVGKTRLAAESVSATDDQCHVARAAGHQASAELPFGALAHLLPAVDHAEEAMRRNQSGL